MTPFFLQTEVFTKRPLFYSPHQMTPIFLLSSLKDPLYSLFSLSPKDPYFGGHVRTHPSLPYVSAPLGNRIKGLETNYRSLLYYHIWTYYARCRCVFIWGTQKLPYNVPKQDQNDIFPEHIGLYQTEYSFNAIFKIKCCCSDWNNWHIWEKCDKLRCMIEC